MQVFIYVILYIATDYYVMYHVRYTEYQYFIL